MKNVFILLNILLSSNLAAQSLLELKSNTLVYQAIFINPNQDTLTTETIELTFTDNPWKWQSKTQKELLITYNPDEHGIEAFLHPFEKVRDKHKKNLQKRKQGKKGWENWTWLEKKSTTGFILNDSLFWMHPPRSNQYLYTEISGMPEIKLNELTIGSAWSTKLIIMMGWHDFKGTVDSEYRIISKTAYQTNSINVQDAWVIKANHIHSKLGEYSSKFIFDDNQYGFLQVDNIYYNGVRIIMNLIEIKNYTQQ